jgi:hypothetical protein
LAEHTAQIETRQVSNIKAEFIANMSRELRAPINT